MSSRIPPLLEPYLTLPPETSLILLTSVLGASTNWLILRFLHSTFLGPDISIGTDAESKDMTKVLFVSFTRDFTFWKENGKRIGLDLEKYASKKRFEFIDGLSGLFMPKQTTPTAGRVDSVLTSSNLQNISEQILNSIRELRASQGERVLLVMDQLDLLLAAGGKGMDAMSNAHAAIITVSADYPLVSSHSTPLETDHAAFLLSVAHQADFVMGVRLLDSGTARDVSGVVSITVRERGTVDEGNVATVIEEKELLYFVGGDGGVRVFERGQ